MIIVVAKLVVLGFLVWAIYRSAKGRDERGEHALAAAGAASGPYAQGSGPGSENAPDAGGDSRSASENDRAPDDASEDVLEGRRSGLLALDGVVNLLFGVALLAFPRPFFDALGLPWTDRGLYATILGGVLVGIGLALLLEGRGRIGVGLGLGGAVAINLIAGGAIAGWLLLTAAGDMSSTGRDVLRLLVLFLVGLSLAEIVSQRRQKPAPSRPAAGS